MVRTFKRKVDHTRRQQYTADQLYKAIVAVKNGLSVRQAVKKFKVPRTTIRNHMYKPLPLANENDNENYENASPSPPQIPKLGRKTVLNEAEEKTLLDILLLCGNWGFPLKVLDIRIIVQGYLNSIGKNVKQFKNNLPGEEWGRAFMKRHKEISLRFGENIKYCRAQISHQAINKYFDELEPQLESIPAKNVVNYDETCYVDDPGRIKFLFRKGRRAENIIDHSRVSTSVMFAVSADGDLLPPYIVYKSKNIYDTWIMNGPNRCAYNRSISGWFTAEIFEDWFDHIALPYFRRLSGPKLLIGDNLASHISYSIIKKAIDEDIKFILLPPNATHLCQPLLDVAVFRPLKGSWRSVIEKWKMNNRGMLPKSSFPLLLNKSIENTKNLKNNIIAGFAATGIVPCNRQKVLSQLPSDISNQAEIAANMLQPVINLLKQNRFSADDKTGNRGRKRKINTPAGRSVRLEDFTGDQEMDDNEFEQDVDEPSNGGNESSSTSDENESNDDTDDENSSKDDENSDEGEGENSGESADENLEEIEPDIGEFFAVKFQTEEDGRCKIYIGQVRAIVEGEGTYFMTFLRRRPGNSFAFPNIEDTETIKRENIVKKLNIRSDRRGLLAFFESTEGYL